MRADDDEDEEDDGDELETMQVSKRVGSAATASRPQSQAMKQHLSLPPLPQGKGAAAGTGRSERASQADKNKSNKRDDNNNNDDNDVKVDADADNNTNPAVSKESLRTSAPASASKWLSCQEPARSSTSSRIVRAQMWSSRLFVCGLTLLCFFLLITRLGLGQYSYSGKGKPPMYGDFEAQRHWMEVTVNLPSDQWYEQTPDNDLQYWGLDYPPLSAHWAWLLGKICQRFLPEFVALHKSRGYEHPTTHSFMRWTVVVSDFLLLVPAAGWLVWTFYRRYRASSRMLVTTLVLLSPALLLIDHAHFQYNGICVALFYLAITLCLRDRCYASACVFTLAILFKQTALYYSLAFFAVHLGVAFRLPISPSSKCSPAVTSLRPTRHCALRVLGLAVTVLGTALVVFSPILLASSNPWASFRQVIHRMFPFARGIFEDKVANFWCISSVVIKWKLLFTTAAMARLSAIVTLVACLPSCVDLFFRPTPKRFIYTTVSVSLAFFMFSFQVHEKGIIFPLAPILLLFLYHPYIVLTFAIVALQSLYPLTVKDGNQVPYWILMFMWLNLPRISTAYTNAASLPFSYWPWTCPVAAALTLPDFPRSSLRQDISILGVKLILLTSAFVQLLVPLLPWSARYPDLHEFLISAHSFVWFFLAWVFFLYFQLVVLRYSDSSSSSSGSTGGGGRVCNSCGVVHTPERNVAGTPNIGEALHASTSTPVTETPSGSSSSSSSSLSTAASHHESQVDSMDAGVAGGLRNRSSVANTPHTRATGSMKRFSRKAL